MAGRSCPVRRRAPPAATLRWRWRQAALADFTASISSAASAHLFQPEAAALDTPVSSSVLVVASEASSEAKAVG